MISLTRRMKPRSSTHCTSTVRIRAKGRGSRTCRTCSRSRRSCSKTAATRRKRLPRCLHDTAEDHGGEGRLDDIDARFGPRVADIVGLCSDSLTADGAEKEPYLPRKRKYIRHLWERVGDAKTDRGYLRVTLADKLHNTRAIARDVEVHGDALYDRLSSLAIREHTRS